MDDVKRLKIAFGVAYCGAIAAFGTTSYSLLKVAKEYDRLNEEYKAVHTAGSYMLSMLHRLEDEGVVVGDEFDHIAIMEIFKETTDKKEK